MNNDKKGRGGDRGGRRPRLNKKKVLISLDQDVYEILQRKANKSSFTNDAIKHYEAFLTSRIEEIESLD